MWAIRGGLLTFEGEVGLEETGLRTEVGVEAELLVGPAPTSALIVEIPHSSQSCESRKVAEFSPLLDAFHRRYINVPGPRGRHPRRLINGVRNVGETINKANHTHLQAQFLGRTDVLGVA